MKTELPDRPAKFARQYPNVWAAFEKLAHQCHQAGPLSPRTRRLVKLGLAVGAGLEGAVHAQVRNALAEGITAEELRHVVLLGVTTLGFPASIRALTWVNDLLRTRTPRRRKRK